VGLLLRNQQRWTAPATSRPDGQKQYEDLYPPGINVIGYDVEYFIASTEDEDDIRAEGQTGH
jgi:hypothetical protein